MRRGSAPAGAAEEGQRLAPYGRALLNWYDAHRRLLPWRLDAAPYRVWVSEIMLQQTRIEAVLPYFDRFMRQLPTIRDLAACGEDRLLKLWEGLGYYSRARNLQKAARVILEQYGGEMPGDYEALLGLPGIGEYTAGGGGVHLLRDPGAGGGRECHAGAGPADGQRGGYPSPRGQAVVYSRRGGHAAARGTGRV